MAPRATPARASVAGAFAPGHVTGVFAPELSSRDPRGRGSVGAGLVLELGVHATARWRPAGRTPRLQISSRETAHLPISRDVARRLLAGRRGNLTIALRHELPIGQGFGMSAAGALATGLAVASVLGLPRARAVQTAHLAELFGGGGLGGVAAILGGGLEIRERPGIPPLGRVRHRRFPIPLILIVVGGALPSPKLLRDPRFLERVRRGARGSIPRLRSRPSAATFLGEAERFTDRLGLAPPAVRRRLTALRATGAWAAQSMFGESVFVAPRTRGQRRAVLALVERARLPAIEIATARRGAHLETVSP